MRTARVEREDRRREFALWVLYASEVSGNPPLVAFGLLRAAVVGTAEPPSAKEASPWHRIERFEDYLPAEADWEDIGRSVEETVVVVEQNRERIDALIKQASPRWRLDRMPPIDRTLLRIGVAEMIATDRPRPRGTLNGLVEIAKRYGEETTPRFVNGILDQIRRNLELPFQ
jgi:N utilization substance protein B